MKYIRFLLALLLVTALGIFAGCGALAAIDRAEDAIENKVDAAEDALEQKVNDAANALIGSDAATGNFNPVDPAQLITPEEAQSIALEHAGIQAEDATGLHTILQIDDGRQEYEVEFRSGHLEYDYEIDAATGTILSFDTDA